MKNREEPGKLTYEDIATISLEDLDELPLIERMRLKKLIHEQEEKKGAYQPDSHNSGSANNL
jgi:hypothetical protein